MVTRRRYLFLSFEGESFFDGEFKLRELQTGQEMTNKSLMGSKRIKIYPSEISSQEPGKRRETRVD